MPRRTLKIPNSRSLVDYGVKGPLYWYMRNEGGKLRPVENFWAFANSQQAAKSARQLEGGMVIRRVIETRYELDS